VRDDLWAAARTHARCEVLDLEPVLVVAGRVDALAAAVGVLDLEPQRVAAVDERRRNGLRPAVPSSSTSWRYGCEKLLAICASWPEPKSRMPWNSSSTPSGPRCIRPNAATGSLPISHRAAFTQ
jgi:hypothetical protein